MAQRSKKAKAGKDAKMKRYIVEYYTESIRGLTIHNKIVDAENIESAKAAVEDAPRKWDIIQRIVISVNEL